MIDTMNTITLPASILPDLLINTLKAQHSTHSNYDYSPNLKQFFALIESIPKNIMNSALSEPELIHTSISFANKRSQDEGKDFTLDKNPIESSLITPYQHLKDMRAIPIHYILDNISDPQLVDSATLYKVLWDLAHQKEELLALKAMDSFQRPLDELLNEKSVGSTPLVEMLFNLKSTPLIQGLLDHMEEPGSWRSQENNPKDLFYFLYKNTRKEDEIYLNEATEILLNNGCVFDFENHAYYREYYNPTKVDMPTLAILKNHLPEEVYEKEYVKGLIQNLSSSVATQLLKEYLVENQNQGKGFFQCNQEAAMTEDTPRWFANFMHDDPEIAEIIGKNRDYLKEMVSLYSDFALNYPKSQSSDAIFASSNWAKVKKINKVPGSAELIEDIIRSGDYFQPIPTASTHSLFHHIYESNPLQFLKEMGLKKTITSLNNNKIPVSSLAPLLRLSAEVEPDKRSNTVNKNLVTFKNLAFWGECVDWSVGINYSSKVDLELYSKAIQSMIRHQKLNAENKPFFDQIQNTMIEFTKHQPQDTYALIHSNAAQWEKISTELYSSIINTYLEKTVIRKEPQKSLPINQRF